MRCAIWEPRRSFLLVVAVAGCSATTAGFVQINPSPRPLFKRTPAQVEMYASAPPARPHVDYGVINVEEGELGPRSPDELMALLRQTAGDFGCDAVVLGAPSSISRGGHHGSNYHVLSGACVVYTTPTVAPPPLPPPSAPPPGQ